MFAQKLDAIELKSNNLIVDEILKTQQGRISRTTE